MSAADEWGGVFRRLEAGLANIPPITPSCFGCLMSACCKASHSAASSKFGLVGTLEGVGRSLVLVGRPVYM